MRQKQPKSEITKEKILAAAESEFSDKGFFGARIDEIAAVAGIAYLVYRYLTPDYLEDFDEDFDDDFDDDFFDDEEVIEVAPATAAAAE